MHCVGAFHPRRSAPGKNHEAELRVEMQGLAKQREECGAVGGSAKVNEAWVGPGVGWIVVTVIAMGGKVAGADGLAKQCEGKWAGGVEDLLHKSVALRDGELHQQGSGAIGERGPKAFHALEANGVVDGDGSGAGRGGDGAEVGLMMRQQNASIRAGFKNLDGLSLQWKQTQGDEGRCDDSVASNAHTFEL